MDLNYRWPFLFYISDFSQTCSNGFRWKILENLEKEFVEYSWRQSSRKVCFYLSRIKQICLLKWISSLLIVSIYQIFGAQTYYILFIQANSYSKQTTSLISPSRPLAGVYLFRWPRLWPTLCAVSLILSSIDDKFSGSEQYVFTREVRLVWH